MPPSDAPPPARTPTAAPAAAGLLADHRVLVTGGARGLGLEFATACAAAGARVVIADLRAERAQQAASTLRDQGHEVLALPLDLADPASVDTCAQAAVAALGRLDGLVNNGAVTDSGGRDFDALAIETWDRVMDVNVRGTWLMTRACRAALATSGRGAVVNLASDTALWGAPRLLAYVASKGAVIAMTRSLARELGGDGITVNAIGPGPIATDLFTKSNPAGAPQTERIINSIVVKRLGTPEDVARAAMFFLSPDNGFVTGQMLYVCGGTTLGVAPI